MNEKTLQHTNLVEELFYNLYSLLEKLDYMEDYNNCHIIDK